MNDRPTYNLEPEPAPRPKRPVPIRTTVLEYEPRHWDRIHSFPVTIQFLLGVVFPYLYWVPLAYMFGGTAYVVPLFFVFLAGFVTIALYLRLRMLWTGLIPGMLCGLLALPLVGVLTCALIVRTLVG